MTPFGFSSLTYTVRGLALSLLCLSAFAELKPIATDKSRHSDVSRREPTANTVKSQSDVDSVPVRQKRQALVQLHTAEELRSLLIRAEKISNSEDTYSTDEPIAFVLHGAEIEIFKRSNYRDNKGLVDLAARLDAFRVIDLKVCQRWMDENNLSEDDLPPFLDVIPRGVDEVQRLERAGYAYF